MNKNLTPVCPIYFENHNFAGHVASIEEFTNCDFGVVRTTFLNGKPYFSASDICNGLYLDIRNVGVFVNEAANDIMCEYKVTPLTRLGGSDFTDIERDLFFYIDIEISHSNGHAEVRQMVKTIFVSEPVLYMLMFRSRKREAVKFKAWLAVEILPNLRVLGRDRASQLLSNEANKLLQTLNKVNEKYKSLQDNAEKYGLMLNSIAELNAMKANGQDVNEKILDQKVNELIYRVDSLGFCSNGIVNNQVNAMNMLVNLNENIINIATGLNSIFGPALNK